MVPKVVIYSGTIAFGLLVILQCSCSSQNSHIGSATMKEDGTILLQLRAEGPGGVLGDALLTYTPGHPDYEKILEHVGGLRPGEEKPVPPWPEE